MSVDARPSQNAWAESLGGVDFPLLADFHPKGEVAKLYDVYNEERGIAMRSAFIIDEEGIIRFSQVYPQGSIPDPTDLLLQLSKM